MTHKNRVTSGWIDLSSIASHCGRYKYTKKYLPECNFEAIWKLIAVGIAHCHVKV